MPTTMTTTGATMMRIITGDEAGLVKVTVIDTQALTAMPSKKLRSQVVARQRPRGVPESSDDKPPTPSPSAVTGTQTFGVVNRDGAVQHIAMSTGDVSQYNDTVVVARACGIVERLSLETGAVLQSYRCFVPGFNPDGSPAPLNKHRKPQHFVGLHEYRGTIIACTDTGMVFYLGDDGAGDGDANDAESDSTIPVLPNGVFSLGQDLLFRMRVHPKFPHIFATGGDERDICIWDVNRKAVDAKSSKTTTTAEATTPHTTDDAVTTPLPLLEPIWRGKNVRNDFLDLRVPVWITELQWLSPDTPTRLVTGTGYHQLRVYDTKQRRPVMDVDVGEYPIKAISVNADQTEFVLADTTGKLTCIDSTTGKVVGKYAGIAGAVTMLHSCHHHDKLISIGIDRKLRVFESTEQRRLMKDVYLKQRLTCMVVDEVWDGSRVSKSSADHDCGVGGDGSESRDVDEADTDAIWKGMQTVDDTVETSATTVSKKRKVRASS